MTSVYSLQGQGEECHPVAGRGRLCPPRTRVAVRKPRAGRPLRLTGRLILLGSVGWGPFGAADAPVGGQQGPNRLDMRRVWRKVALADVFQPKGVCEAENPERPPWSSVLQPRAGGPDAGSQAAGDVACPCSRKQRARSQTTGRRNLCSRHCSSRGPGSSGRVSCAHSWPPPGRSCCHCSPGVARYAGLRGPVPAGLRGAT